jgi:hypothetical protein
MTTITAARESLYTEFYNSFTGVPQARITFDNEKFDPPEDVSWVRFAVRHFGGGQESLGDVGARKFNRTGAAFVQVFIPQDTGIRDADTLAQEARTVLEGKTLLSGAVRTFDSEIREIGLNDGYFMVVVETRFEYTETR